MKYLRSDAINQNIKRNYTKKYQHKLNIITFLKSNYKYKRRCTINYATKRRQRQRQNVRQWRQQQTHPLPVGGGKWIDHRFANNVFLHTTKDSKFPRIFFLIMHSSLTAAAAVAIRTTTAAPQRPTSTTIVNGLLRSFIVRIKWNAEASSKLAATNSADGFTRQTNAYKDANEDTNIKNVTTSLINRHHNDVGDEMRYQHSNYDKVSTITSTPSLSCKRQNHHQMQSAAVAISTKEAATFPPISPLLLSSSSSSSSPSSSVVHRNYDETERYFTAKTSPLRHRFQHKHSNRHARHTKKSATTTTTTTRDNNMDGINFNRCNITLNNKNALKHTFNTSSFQSVDQYINAGPNSSSYTISLILTLFIVLAAGVRTTTAGACWQTVLGNGKCNEIFSFNVSKNECCGANQEFAYTDREPTNVEYFFATAIGGGMECTPCLESCRNVKCGPNKKCVKRKGRPKCVCAPECGAARRRRLQREQHTQQQQHHSSAATPKGVGRSRQSRDTHSLGSEITKVNLGSESQQSQRKLIHIHMQQDYAHQQEVSKQPKRKNQQPKGNRRLLITANVEHTEKPTTRRIQLFSNVRTTYARRRTSSDNNGQHEATDLSEDYDEDDYDDDEDDKEDGDADDSGEEGHRRRGISFNNGFSYNNNRNDDATRFLNQSLSRHTLKTNKNNNDLQTTKIQQRDQYASNNSHVRHPQQIGQHAEGSPGNNRQHHHRHQKQNQHHRHHHHHDHHDHHNRHDQQTHHHNNNRQQSQNAGRRKHSQEWHKERPHVRKHPKNHRDYSTISSVITNKVSQSTHKASLLNLSTSTLPTAIFTSPQPQLLPPPPTTPVNSTLSVPSDQSHLTNHGSKLATSSSLPPPPSLSSSASPSHSNEHSGFATMSVAASTSPSASSTSTSSFASLGNANGGGVSHHHHDSGGKASPDVAATTTDGFNDNDNTISTLNSNAHDEHFHNFADQFEVQAFPKSHHAITVTDSLRPSNPVCGTDGRTYNTECQLRKRSCRTDNPNLKVAYRGHCRTTCNGVKCIGLTCVEDQYTMPHCIACKVECPLDDYDNANNVMDATRAVCGADGKTYKSMCDINRIICKIGRSIGVAYPGPCRGDHITCDDINCGPKQVCLLDLLTHKPRCTPCRYKCSRKRNPSSLRFEEDKICGVNNRTYNSWCEMRKDSCSTGFYIDVKYAGYCH